MDNYISYLRYVDKHLDLTTEYLRPRLPGESEESYIRNRMWVDREISYLEEKYPEYTQRFKIEYELWLPGLSFSPKHGL